MPGYKDFTKKYNKQSQSTLSLNLDGLHSNGFTSPDISLSSGDNCEHTTRTSKYHCNCHAIPESDFYLTPLQRKTILLKGYKKEIGELEKTDKLKDEKIKILEEQVAQLSKQVSNGYRKSLNSYEKKNNTDAKSLSILYNKIGRNLADIKEDLNLLSDSFSYMFPSSQPNKKALGSRNFSHTNGHRPTTTPPANHTPPRPIAPTLITPNRQPRPDLNGHVTAIRDGLDRVELGLAQFHTLSQESCDDWASATESATEAQAECRARLGFLKDALYHYLLEVGKLGTLDNSNINYKAVCAILNFTEEQKTALTALGS